jgi:hypothetical protein
MTWRSIPAATAVLAAVSLAAAAFAGADDYVFEPVNAEIKSSNVATVAVRLVHKPTGKPVTDTEFAYDWPPRVVPMPRALRASAIW